MEFECDTLMLSIGLIPYVSLLNNIDCPTSSTRGAIVYDNMETMFDGIFACGNCLHVHDVVDFVTIEGRNAGHGAAQYIKAKEEHGSLKIEVDQNLAYVVPQFVRTPVKEDLVLKFRVRRELRDKKVVVRHKDQVVFSQIKLVMIPSEMVILTIKKENLVDITEPLKVSVEDR